MKSDRIATHYAAIYNDMKNTLISMLLAVLLLLFFVDPPIKLKVTCDEFESQYDWRLFNNFFCSHKTSGHCYNNETNKLNAEIDLAIQLLDNYSGQKVYEEKLKEIVSTNHRLDISYSEIVNSSNISIDSLKRYKDVIFKRIYLK